MLRRHPLLVTAGIFLSVALALFSYVRISAEGSDYRLTYRASEVWSNEATLVFSQPGFPEWRLRRSESATDAPGRIVSLMDVYAVYATSDPVLMTLERRGLIDAQEAVVDGSPIEAKAVPSALGAPTPLMTIAAREDTPAAATRLTVAATDAFVAYLRSRQNADGIPENERLQVRVVKRFGEPTLAKARSKTGLVAILLAGLTATLAAAFVRDNLQRTRLHGIGDAEVASVPEAVSLSAVPGAAEPASPLASAAASAEQEPSSADRESAEPKSGASASRWTPRSPG